MDTTGGPITIMFPDSPTFEQSWIVKDRLCDAETNPITITSVTGAILFDGMTDYQLDDNFESVNLMANNGPESTPVSYELF